MRRLTLILLLLCSPAFAGRNFAHYSTDKINFGSAASLDDLYSQGGGGMTAWCWINLSDVSGGSDNRMISKNQWALATSSGTTGGFYFYHATSGDAVFREAANASFGLNVWTFLAATWDGSLTAANIHLYTGVTPSSIAEVSYASSGDGTGSISTDASSDYVIGNESAGGSLGPGGTFAACGAANIVLTLVQIQSLAATNSPRADFPAPAIKLLAPLWGTATTESDLSGNSNNGTVTGATVADHCPCGRYRPGVLQ